MSFLSASSWCATMVYKYLCKRQAAQDFYCSHGKIFLTGLYHLKEIQQVSGFHFVPLSSFSEPFLTKRAMKKPSLSSTGSVRSRCSAAREKNKK